MQGQSPLGHQCLRRVGSSLATDETAGRLEPTSNKRVEQVLVLRALQPQPLPGEKPWAGAVLGLAGFGSHSPCSLPGRPAQCPEPSPLESEPQVSEASQIAAEGPPSPEASRSPARGAYLQSLEPSSRRWVLGGAKPPEDVTLGPGAPGGRESAGEIWYNPIPEEDPRPLGPESPGPQPGSADPEGPSAQGELAPALHPGPSR